MEQTTGVRNEIIDQLILKNDTKIVFLVIDGLGGLPSTEKGGTELQVARIPNLDSLATSSICGLLDPIAPGITPGSGSAHLALFGYDPIKYQVGRGTVEGLGIDFPFAPEDVAARLNFITVDEEGKILDRRAGRIDDATNKRLCKKLKRTIDLGPNVELFLETSWLHGSLFVLRGDGLSPEVGDTDPYRENVPPLRVKATGPGGKVTASLVRRFIAQSKKTLAKEYPANMVALRGFSRYISLPSFQERFKLRALAIVGYPFYKGIARLLGMEVLTPIRDLRQAFQSLRDYYADYDFFYIHAKYPDYYAEEGDFDAKVRALEDVDRLLPKITQLNPDVLVITGDHSTPSVMAMHSWHPVPVLINSRYCQPDPVRQFNEISCILGGLGRQPALSLMPLILANAQRLAKFGA